MRQVLLIVAAGCVFVGASFGQAANQQASSDQGAATPPYTVPTATQKQDLEQSLKPVFFAFDRYDLTPEDQQTLQADANWLKANPDVYVTIAGDADERGSIVYNVVLSQERAEATRDALVSLGVPADHIVFATGWGKLYPTCEQSDESCWSQNRRAHFEPWQAGSLAASKASSGRSEVARTVPGK